MHEAMHRAVGQADDGQSADALGTRSERITARSGFGMAAWPGMISHPANGLTRWSFSRIRTDHPRIGHK